MVKIVNQSSLAKVSLNVFMKTGNTRLGVTLRLFPAESHGKLFLARPRSFFAEGAGVSQHTGYQGKVSIAALACDSLPQELHLLPFGG